MLGNKFDQTIFEGKGSFKLCSVVRKLSEKNWKEHLVQIQNYLVQQNKEKIVHLFH